MKEKIIRQGWTYLKLEFAPGCLLCSDKKHENCKIKGKCTYSISAEYKTKHNTAGVEYQNCRKVQVIARETN